MLFRTRDLLVRQSTQLINALRGHLSEHGVVAPRGPANVKILAEAIEERRHRFRFSSWSCRALSSIRSTDCRRRSPNSRRRRLTKPRAGRQLPPANHAGRGADYGHGDRDLRAADDRLQARARFRRLARARSEATFDRRQAASWKDSKMGQRDIRRLLITGAMAVVRWASWKGAPEGTWLYRMLARKPRMLVAIALANKMARSIWAMLTKNEDYRVPWLRRPD